MKNKIIDALKTFILVFSMTMGFLFTYLVVWLSIGLPVNWTTGLLIPLSFLTYYGFYKWICKED